MASVAPSCNLPLPSLVLLWSPLDFPYLSLPSSVSRPSAWVLFTLLLGPCTLAALFSAQTAFRPSLFRRGCQTRFRLARQRFCFVLTRDPPPVSCFPSPPLVGSYVIDASLLGPPTGTRYWENNWENILGPPSHLLDPPTGPIDRMHFTLTVG